MSKTISILSETDNVGKTTTAANLAVTLGLFEKKTLFIDSTVNIKNFLINNSIEVENSDGEIIRTKMRFLNLLSIPYDQPKNFNFSTFEKIDESFDYIIINSPKLENKLFDFILTATDWIVIPFELKENLVQDLHILVQNLREQSKDPNYCFKIAGILLNKYNGLNDFSIEKFDKDGIFFDTKIPFFENKNIIEKAVFFSNIKSNDRKHILILLLKLSTKHL
ncbi:MAG: ParA family protein [Desulfobacterales bacterium]|nr:ParA family protein [Desulfobacterales bacterium]